MIPITRTGARVLIAGINVEFDCDEFAWATWLRRLANKIMRLPASLVGLRSVVCAILVLTWAAALLESA